MKNMDLKNLEHMEEELYALFCILSSLADFYKQL